MIINERKKKARARANEKAREKAKEKDIQVEEKYGNEEENVFCNKIARFGNHVWNANELRQLIQEGFEQLVSDDFFKYGNLNVHIE